MADLVPPSLLDTNLHVENMLACTSVCGTGVCIYLLMRGTTVCFMSKFDHWPWVICTQSHKYDQAQSQYYLDNHSVGVTPQLYPQFYFSSSLTGRCCVHNQMTLIELWQEITPALSIFSPRCSKSCSPVSHRGPCGGYPPTPSSEQHCWSNSINDVWRATTIPAS